MIADRFGHFLDMPLAPLARRIRVAPNLLTVVGFVITLLAAVLLATNPRAGGLLVLAGAAFDMLDGIVARVNSRSTPFGAYLDSVVDRYSDASMFIGLAWFFHAQGKPLGSLLCVLILVGALLTSYARARAEGVGIPCSVGIMERPERILLFCFGCISGWLLPVLWTMLALAHLTVIQRISRVWEVTDRAREVPTENKAP